MMVGFDTERVGVALACSDGVLQTFPNWWSGSTVIRNGRRTSTVAVAAIGVESTRDEVCTDCLPVIVASNTDWLFEYIGSTCDG